MDYIKGIYTKELYHNDKNNYYVGVLKLLETNIEELRNKNSVYFTGNLINLSYRKSYKMYGDLTRHPKYGIQFLVTTYEEDLPTKKDELIEFLSSDLFPIGEVTAKKIVNLYPEKTIETILANPNCLLMIPRLSEKRIKRIHEVLNNYKSTSEVILKLTKMGFTNKDSLSLFSKYKTTITNIIEEDIYSLVEEKDLTFLEIDEIAKNIGIIENDDRRLKALIIYVMETLTFEQGDTYLYLNEILTFVNRFYSITSFELENLIIKLNKLGKIIIEDDKYYLKKYYDAEHYIANRLCFLNNIPYKNIKELDKELKKEEKNNKIIYDETQKLAIKKSLTSNLTIITGGPGTGKTTIIKAIVNLLKKVYQVKDNEIALLAPTGRAARRLMETTTLPAYTIHKYLMWDKETNKFAINENNPNPEKYLIIDESSMIDTILMSSLLKGITEKVKIVMVGDYYQLPSVAQGQILKDLIDSDMLDVISLNRLYRQNEESYIVNLAYEIKNKDISEYFTAKKDDYNFLECSSEDVLNVISNVISKAIEKGYTENDIQVLAPMYKSINGIDNLNIMLQEKFNPKDSNRNELKIKDVIYREGDKILQLVNDPDNNISNGDLGYIESIKNDNKQEEIRINYDGIRVKYQKDKFVNFRHGYAISIHKSQGSEFKMVIIPFVSSFKRMLYNKLVYTAVTRSKEKLILVGDVNAFIYGVKNDYIENRKTSLKDIIVKKYNK